MLRRLALATVIAGVLITGAGTAALVNQDHSAAAMASVAASPAAQAMTVAAGHKGQRGRHIITVLQRHRGHRRVLRVTAVNGDVISATTLGSQAVTVTVSATTVYTEAGAAASLSAIHPGSIIAVRGARAAARTANATGIVILLPHLRGVVTAVNGSTLTITGRDAALHTITVDSNTRYLKAGQTAALTDIATGSAIMAQGTLNSDGSLSALRISIVLPHVAGKVTAVNGSSITITNIWGATHTVITSSGTTYAMPGAKTATAASVIVGARIAAAGTLSADGQTLNAVRISIMPRGGVAARRAHLKHLIMGRLGGQVSSPLGSATSAV